MRSPSAARLLCAPLTLPGVAPLRPAGAQLDKAAGGKAHSHEAARLAHALAADATVGEDKLQDAARALLQIVWLTSVPRATLESLL